MGIRVERAEGENNTALLDAYLRLFNSAENLRYLSYTGIPFTREQLAGWMREAQSSGVLYYTAAGENGGIAGIMVVRHSRTEGFEILGLAVDSAARCRGAGRALVRTALDKAAEYGYRAVDVAVFADNRPMLCLTVGMGFKPVRVEHRKRFDGEDAVWLKLGV